MKSDQQPVHDRVIGMLSNLQLVHDWVKCTVINVHKWLMHCQPHTLVSYGWLIVQASVVVCASGCA